jgi:aminoglycoside phosphotransferase (APT) family kinase protein
MTSLSPARLTAEELPAALEPILRKRIPGAEQANIANWSASAQGYSTETFLFDLVGVTAPDTADTDTLGLVFRRSPEFAVLPDFDLRRQFLVMQRLAGSPVPVPVMRWIDANGSDLGAPYFVMDRIDDVVTVSDAPAYHHHGVYADTDDAGRARFWNGCVDLIATVHQVDPTQFRLGFLDLRNYGSNPPERLVNFLRYALTWSSGDKPLHKGLALALAWLDAHLYIPDRIGLCWGDSRMSNVLYAAADHRPVAALDWEISYLGDPGADIAWMFMSDWISSPFDNHAPAPGTPSREETIERYERLTGHRLTNMAFHDVTAALLLAVPLIRLNEKLNLDGVDLADICAERVQFVLAGQ